MAQVITIKTEAPDSALSRKIVSILKTEITRRTGLPVASGDKPRALTITLAIQAVRGKEGFRIESAGSHGVRISGHDERGLLYGVGQFLRQASYAKGRFQPGIWQGDSVPECPVRMMYFATHFHNFYHEAPLSEIRAYIQELALWGYNSIGVWFDMHHFNGIRDPRSQRMIRRLHAIMQAANAVGMGASLLMLSNEAYAHSPVRMRADWTAGHDDYFKAPRGHYHVELCPNKPGAKALLLKWREEIFRAFADITLEYVVIWPYDQGGCTCPKCAPWGANGFLTIAKPIAQLSRRYFPQAKIILSTWYFDKFTHGEWSGLDTAFRKGGWVDYILADDNGTNFPAYPLKRGVPGHLPLVNFPEISMCNMSPWGGYGANPMPEHFQKIWDVSGRKLSGGLPYSEGIFEDMNKFIFSRFYWSGAIPAIDAVREYAAYYVSPHWAKAITQAVSILEKNMDYRWALCSCGRGFSRHQHGQGHDYGAAKVWHLFKKIDAKLPAWARQEMRWRLLVLRATLDYELIRTGGRITPAMNRAFDEITRRYHAYHPDIHPAVHPPNCQVQQKQQRFQAGKDFPARAW